MPMLIGPILRRDAGYAFATGEPEKPLNSVAPYRRIEDAYYARRVAILSASRNGCGGVVVCETFDELKSWLERSGKVLHVA